MRRISIRDKLFTECIGEDEVLVDDDEYNMVVVNAAGISRAYYEGDYDPDRLMLPTCWSADTQVPSPDVPREQRQANRCITKMYFDTDSDTPKLFFKPSRSLRDEELSVASEMINHPDTIRAITLEYTPFEGSTKSPFAETSGFQH